MNIINNLFKKENKYWEEFKQNNVFRKYINGDNAQIHCVNEDIKINEITIGAVDLGITYYRPDTWDNKNQLTLRGCDIKNGIITNRIYTKNKLINILEGKYKHITNGYFYSDKNSKNTSVNLNIKIDTKDKFGDKVILLYGCYVFKRQKIKSGNKIWFNHQNSENMFMNW